MGTRLVVGCDGPEQPLGWVAKRGQHQGFACVVAKAIVFGLSWLRGFRAGGRVEIAAALGGLGGSTGVPAERP